MKYKFFFVPAHYPDSSEKALNDFLSNNSILSVKKGFYRRGDQPGWSVCVGWVNAGSLPPQETTTKQAHRESLDYRKILNEEDFVVYAGLRDLRKTISEEIGSPVYQIFSNKQLAAMVTQRVRSEKALSEIVGVGSSRLQRFAERFLTLLEQLQETSD